MIVDVGFYEHLLNNFSKYFIVLIRHYLLLFRRLLDILLLDRPTNLIQIQFFLLRLQYQRTYINL